mmetsp:Transcript_40939/g.76669  ORF Transcript_40939/g.76669 Transcript_40939/m.76669 type:complete len:371 (+) Transcript_40939:230-1342(+)
MCRTPSETVVGARTDLTLHEISGHKTREDCWLIIDEKVYDVSDWISRHPGGEQILLMYAGTDATDVFKAFHHPREFKRLSAYHVGNLKHGEIHPSEGLKDFRKLNSELWEQGHFEPVLNFHYKIFAIAMSLMVACIMLLKIASMPTTSVASRYILVGTAGLCLAQFWQQSLLIAHDACHTGITRKRKVDVLLGQLFGTLGAGIGATWWTKDHNEHHAVTNQVERERGGDRTAGALPVLTVHELQLEWELRDQGKGARKGQQLWYWALLQLQYFLYAPIILIVARFNLHIISVVLAEKNMRLVLDMFLMAGFGVVTYGVCSMAPEGFRLGFYAVAHVSVSVLHMIIAMNHFHMPMCAPRPGLAVGIAALWV